MDEHVMELLGKSRAVVREGKIVEVTEPKISYCPLFRKLYGMERITKDEVVKNLRYRMENFGLFTAKRKILDERTFATFGTSEIFFSCLKSGFLDAVVIAADCAGTVVTSNPKLVQGLGGRISGLIRTSPIPEVIERIEKEGGFVVSKNAEIDQIKGVLFAVDKGFKKIGVTLTTPEEAKACAEIEKNRDVKILKFAVHTTGVDWSLEDALLFDLITLCASKSLRDKLRGVLKAQAGEAIPIVAISDFGKLALLERAKDLDGILIISKPLPYLSENQPKPLV
ncbi:MAG: DUF2099 family protein [Archaeoglobales archaeon]|nr:DUF2099 family protein [Archaeoglobales archaeon]TDA27173.1 MAG: hypothetical protein DSO01_03770 [Archaeoglobi archaeon]TDA28126.1 MAG: hypothetical protein DSN99_03060 [Archaeoglobi archaeon]TDA29429.1 MAG: hypothetical protein DSO00_04210 [Archaeoglobi archaeon]